ncbi:ATP-binding cassette domain-containing protein [Paenibacillus amylolyticus]|nr:ATP-binding cassette domain-containing protein [Paenibacillus amylolyticus]
MGPPAIKFHHVCKTYSNSNEYAVNHVNLSIDEGEFITILGSSGSGKTTLLKMVKPLYEPSQGNIQLFGEDIAAIDPVMLRRKIGYVIQQVGLFLHMTIAKNIANCTCLLKWDKEKTEQRVSELLHLVGLDPRTYEHRYPSQLSGGQQQRN